MSIRITRSRGIHVDKNAARPGSEGGEGSNLQNNSTTITPHRASRRGTLTPAQRGRFWQSVVDSGAAAKAGMGEEGRT